MSWPAPDAELIESDATSSRESSRESSPELEVPGRRSKGTGKFSVFGQHCFVTYSKSPVGEAERFYELLRAKMPEGTEMFGCQEPHQDGWPHYHVVIRFPNRVHWRDARSRFRLGDGTDAEGGGSLCIRVPEPRQPVAGFLEGCQAYCTKDEDPVLFGKWIMTAGAKLAERRELYKRIVFDLPYDEARRALVEDDPIAFVNHYVAISAFLNKEKAKPNRGRRMAKNFEVQPWRLPKEVEEWKRVNVDSPPNGRRRALVLVGAAMTGKSYWAESFGDPDVFHGQWNLRKYREESTHVVVNDGCVAKFGASGSSYWRQLLGCQDIIDVHDRYAPTTELVLGKAVIWTANYDNDPRKSADVASYLAQCGATVVDIRDQPLFASPRGVEVARPKGGGSPPDGSEEVSRKRSLHEDGVSGVGRKRMRI